MTPANDDSAALTEAAAVRSSPLDFETVFSYGTAIQQRLSEDIVVIMIFQEKFREHLDDVVVAQQIISAEKSALSEEELTQLAQGGPEMRDALKTALTGLVSGLNSLEERLRGFSDVSRELQHLRDQTIGNQASLLSYIAEGHSLLRDYDRRIEDAEHACTQSGEWEEEDNLRLMRSRRETIEERVWSLEANRGTSSVNVQMIAACIKMQNECAEKFEGMLGAETPTTAAPFSRLQTLLKLIGKEDLLEEIRNMNEGLRQEMPVMKPLQLKQKAPRPAM